MAAALLVLLLLLAIWFGITGARLLSNAMGLRSSAIALDQSGRAGDVAAVAPVLPVIAKQSAAVAGTLSSAPWSWTQSLPVVGGTMAAAATFADATQSVFGQAAGLAPVLQSVADADTLAAAVDGVDRFNPQVAATLAALQQADQRVTALNPDEVIWPLRDKVARGREQFLAADDLAVGAVAAAQVLPGLLGTSAPAKWLVLLSQPAEVRGSGGGFFGAYATFAASQGTVTMAAAAPNDAVASVKQDLSTLPGEYRQLWGSDANYLWGYNLTRHFPYAAQVARQGLAPDADYVVAMDPRMVAGLLTLTGPVTVNGITLNAGNAEAFFTRDVYLQFGDSRVKDQITIAFLNEVFGKLSADPPDPTAMWKALAPAIGGQHLQVWSPDPAPAQALALSPLGGAVPATDIPWVTVAFNNSAGNKIDSYVDSALQYRVVGSCDAEWVSGEVTATLDLEQLPPGLPSVISGRNDEPTAPYGTSSMLVHLYAPVGAFGTGVTVDGAPAKAVQGEELGHPVWGVKVQLQPGKPVTVRSTFDQHPYPGIPLRAQAQPMVHDTKVSIVDERSCAG